MGLGKFIAISALILCIAGLASAQTLSAPSSFTATQESREFSIKVFNDSNQSQFLSIELVSPIGYEVDPTPLSIPAFASQTFKIKLLPSKEQSNETIQSLLVARFSGQAAAEKKIILEIGDFTAKKQNQDSNFFAGLTILPGIGEINWEQAADIVLIIIIIILVIALIARLIARNNRKKAREEFK